MSSHDMNATGVPVASLVRVSTETQALDHRQGLPRQRAAVAEACQRHGLRVVHAAELRGVSGHVVGQTPEWGRIRVLLDAGEIRGVVVDAIDRICRASELDLSVLSDIQRVGGAIYTPGEVRDMSSGADGLLTGILALLGGMEKRDIKRRFREAKRAARRQGKWPEGTHMLPQGVAYCHETHRWSYTEEAEPIRRLAQRYAAGQGSVSKIAASLGIPYRQALGALRLPYYRGVISDKGGGWVTVLDPPLIDDRTAAAIDARLAGHQRAYDGRRRRRARSGDDVDLYALRGVGVCALCGSRLDTTFARTRTRAVRYYRCAKASRHYLRKSGPAACAAQSIPIDDAHWAVSQQLRRSLEGQGAEAAAAAALLDAVPPDDAAEIARLRAHLDGLSRKSSRLVDLHISGRLELAEYDQRRADLDRQITAVSAELGGLEAAQADVKSGGEALAALAELVRAEAVDGDCTRLCRVLRDVGGRVALERVRPACADGPVDLDEGGVIWTPADRRPRPLGVRIARADVDVASALAVAARAVVTPAPVPDGTAPTPPKPRGKRSRARTKSAASCDDRV